MIVGFLEQNAEGGVRLWYSHHEHYTRKRKNLRWNHCFTGEIGYLSDRKDPEGHWQGNASQAEAAPR